MTDWKGCKECSENSELGEIGARNAGDDDKCGRHIERFYRRSLHLIRLDSSTISCTKPTGMALEAPVGVEWHFN